MSSINLDLDFQDYTASSSNVKTIPQQQKQPEVQVRISLPTNNDANLKQNIQSAKSVLNVLQNLQTGQSSSAGGNSLSDEALQQLIWLSSRQKSKQQQRSSGGSWGLGYLAQYFDVTTVDVVQRILWSAVPIRKIGIDLDDLCDSELTESLTNNMALRSGGDNDSRSLSGNDMNSRLYEHINSGKQKRYSYMERFIQSRPDFYGPFWVSATLIFAVAIFSNLVSFFNFRSKLYQAEMLMESSSVNHTKESTISQFIQTEDWHYSMEELNMTTSVVMFYVALLPTFLWFLFWFRGCTKYYTLTETICAYGYSLSIFIPLSALLMVQATFLRYLAITLASTLSGLALVMSFLPIAQSDPNNKGATHIILILVAACHFGFAYILHRIMLQ